MRPAEIKDFLAAVSDGRWSRLFRRLDSGAGGALALALGNPLMLSLCAAIYTDRSPDELADRYRFAQRAVIEEHLLSRFVQAAYASASSPVDAGKFRCTEDQARRWLSFLAGHSESWWNLYRAEHGGWRILGPVVRSILRIIIVAALAIWLLAQHGSWRHGWYRGPVHFSSLMLGGQLGRLARPVAAQLLPPRTASLVIAGIAGGFVLMTELAHLGPMFPARVSIRPFKTLRKVLGATVMLWLLAAGVMVWWLAQERRHLPVVTFIGSRSTLVTLLAVALGGLLWLPGTLIVPTDRRGPVSPPESLRLDQQADIVVTLLWRSAVTAILGVWAGAQIALAYAIWAAAATLIALLLGGRGSFASRSYTDASLSLALRRRLPRQIMAFMVDAESRGILRATGADYEFRHIRVQQQLHDSWERGRWLDLDTRREKRRDLRERLTRPEESLAGLTQTVQEYRTLARNSEPEAFAEFGPKLAVSLSGLAAKLGALGQRDSEIDAISERTGVYRSLAEQDPDTFRPQLATSLGELAARLASIERFSESLGITREAVGIWQELARADTAHQLDLAGSLGRLVWNLKPLAGRADNLQPVEDVVECLREVEPSDATVRPWLAEALVHQAFTLRASGRLDESSKVMAQALNVYRQLADEKRYHDERRDDPESAVIVSSQPQDDGITSDPSHQVAVERRVAAKVIWDELSQIAEKYRHLSRTKSGAFLPDLYWALDLMGDLRPPLAAGSSDEYLAASREAHQIWWIYLKHFDNSYLWGSQGPYCLLSDLAEPLWKTGQYEDAMTVIEIAREFGRDYYLRFDHEKWIHWWQRHSRANRWRRILAENGWSLAIGSPDWQKDYARALGIMAGDMDDIAFELAVQGRRAEAEAKAAESATTCRQAIAIYRELSQAQPATFLPDLVRSLNVLAAELRKTGKPEDGEQANAASAEATTLRRSLGLPPDQSGLET